MCSRELSYRFHRHCGGHCWYWRYFWLYRGRRLFWLRHCDYYGSFLHRRPHRYTLATKTDSTIFSFAEAMLLFLSRCNSSHDVCMLACRCLSLASTRFAVCAVAENCPTGSTGTVPGTAGTGGTSGCTVDAGYSGSVTATTTAPFYTEDLTGTPWPRRLCCCSCSGDDAFLSADHRRVCLVCSVHFLSQNSLDHTCLSVCSDSTLRFAVCAVAVGASLCLHVCVILSCDCLFLMLIVMCVSSFVLWCIDRGQQ